MSDGGVSRDYYAGMQRGIQEERERIIGLCGEIIDRLIPASLTSEGRERRIQYMIDIISGEDYER